MAKPTDSTVADVPIFKAVLVGVGAGFLSGLFGVGGGVLMVPALVLVLSLDQRLAHGTSLGAVVPIAVSSTLSYAISDEVDGTVAAALIVGAVGGAVIGTHLLRFVHQKALAYGFSLVMLITAVRLVADQASSSGRATLSILGVVVLILVGLAAGVLAGLLGVGGGIVMVPMMVVGFDMSAALAKGTSLAVIVPTAVMGTWRNRKHGNVHLRVAVVAGLAGVLSAFAAAQISVGMSEGLSNDLFAGLITVVALRMIWKERSAAPDPANS